MLADWHEQLASGMRLETEMLTEHSNVVWDVNIYEFLSCFYPFKVRFRYWFDLSVYVCPGKWTHALASERQEYYMSYKKMFFDLLWLLKDDTSEKTTLV